MGEGKEPSPAAQLCIDTQVGEIPGGRQLQRVSTDPDLVADQLYSLKTAPILEPLCHHLQSGMAVTTASTCWVPLHQSSF